MQQPTTYSVREFFTAGQMLWIKIFNQLSLMAVIEQALQRAVTYHHIVKRVLIALVAANTME